MPSIDLPTPSAAAADHCGTVAVLAFDGMAPFEMSSVVEIFGMPRPELGVPWYRLFVCGETREPMRVVGGFSITVEHGLDVLAAADTVVITAVPDVRGDVSPALIEALRTARARGARIVSICSGAFALAAAGLLDDRAATTHWKYADLLAERYPRVRVDPDVLYVDGDDVLTSAGSAAGLDLCLHLVRKDHGARVANSVARRLVVPPHREGGQAQFIQAAVGEIDADDGIGRSMVWALDHLAEPITVAGLAAQAHVSQRTYLRKFAAQTGTSPVRWVLAQRVAASLSLLEDTAASVEAVGAAVGFESPVTFRHHFGRAMGTSPSAYRRTFRTSVA